MIEFQEANLGYPSFTALEDFNCLISKGEIVTFFGPSGCGKSTIIKTLMDIINPISGHVFINSNPAAEYSLPIAYTPQDNQLLPWLSVKENIILWQKDSQHNNKFLNALQIPDILRIIQMEHRSDYLPGELSGGQSRRTALGRCLATNSEIMFLDEALVAVERKFRKDVMVQLRKHLKENEITTIIISHDYEEAVFMSDRIYVLSPSPAEIINVINCGDNGLESNRDITAFNTEAFMKTSHQLIN